MPTHEGYYRFYLTNLTRTVGPSSVADIYRVRWESELDNKLDKSCNQLDQIAARTPPAVRALVHASLVSSMLASLIVYKHRLRQWPAPRRRAERTVPPLHVQSLARAMGATAQHR